jgi:hypothetical protein
VIGKTALVFKKCYHYHFDKQEAKMTIDPIGSVAPSYQAMRIGPSGDNEATERVPDNEAVELARKAPLAPYQGNQIDLEA